MSVKRKAVRGLGALLSVLGLTVASTVATGASAQAAFPLYRIQRTNGTISKCLDSKTEDPPSNAQVQQWHCSGGDEQNFEVINAATGGLLGVEIVDKRNQNCLTVPSPNELTLGADIRMTTCSLRGPNQLWKLITVGNAQMIQQLGSGLCLDVRNASWDDGAHLQQWTCKRNSDAQLWYFYG